MKRLIITAAALPFLIAAPAGASHVLQESADRLFSLSHTTSDGRMLDHWAYRNEEGRTIYVLGDCRIGGPDTDEAALSPQEMESRCNRMGQLRGEHARMRADHNQMRAEHARTHENHRQLHASHEQMRAEHARKHADHEQLRARHEQLRAEHARIRAEHEQLEAGQTELE